MIKGYPVYIHVGSGLYLDLYGTIKNIPGIEQHQDFLSPILDSPDLILDILL